jgi:hypothetical protein
METREDAGVTLEVLMASPETMYHARDTEVMDIHLNIKGPVVKRLFKTSIDELPFEAMNAFEEC